MLLHPPWEIGRRERYTLLFRLEQEIGENDNGPIYNPSVTVRLSIDLHRYAATDRQATGNLEPAA